MKLQVKKIKEIKAEKISEFGKKVAKAKTIAFADYHGLGANELAILRDKIKQAGGEFLVEKNTLIRKALSKSHHEFPKDQLTGPTGVIFAFEDEIAPIRQVAETNKISGSPKFKFAYLEGNLLNTQALENLAKIPGKDVLQGQLVRGLSSPIYGFINVLSANIRNLVYVLNKISSKNES